VLKDQYWIGILQSRPEHAARVFQRLLEAVDPSWLKTAVLEPIVYNGADNTGGLTPQLTSTPTEAASPRLFNRMVTFSVTRHGTRWPLDRRFFDPFRGQFLR